MKRADITTAWMQDYWLLPAGIVSYLYEDDISDAQPRAEEVWK